MPQQLQPFQIRNLGIYGVIRQAEVDDGLQPNETVVEAINVHFDRKGAVMTRPGMKSIQSTAVSSSYPCVGLFQFNYSTGSALLSVFSDGSNNDIYSLNGVYWAKVHEDDTAGSKTRFVTFEDYVVKMNGNDTMFAWSGSGNWTGSGNPLNIDDLTTQGGHTANIKPKFGEVFRAKVYFSGDSTNPDRLYYSSVVSSAGNITWTPGTNYIDINPNDGENITGLKRYGTQLIIFKPNYIYRFFGNEGVDPEPLISVGTRSQESIVVGKDGLYFHHDTGFYKYAGGFPKEISRPISDFVKAIPVSYYVNVSGLKDEDHIYWSIGDLTIDGVVFSNIAVRYTISSEIWTIYSYSKEMRWGCDYNDGIKINQVIGTDDGWIMKLNEGTSDNGSAINYRLITKWYEIEGIENQKTIDELATVCEKAQGAMLMYQVDDDPAFQQIGQITKFLNDFDNQGITFHRIRFKITGNTNSESGIFRGIDIIKGINEGLII